MVASLITLQVCKGGTSFGPVAAWVSLSGLWGSEGLFRV